jgi:hypothetical protein
MVTVIGRWLSVCVAAGLVASASSLGAQRSNVIAPAELP